MLSYADGSMRSNARPIWMQPVPMMLLPLNMDVILFHQLVLFFRFQHILLRELTYILSLRCDGKKFCNNSKDKYKNHDNEYSGNDNEYSGNDVNDVNDYDDDNDYDYEDSVNDVDDADSKLKVNISNHNNRNNNNDNNGTNSSNGDISMQTQYTDGWTAHRSNSWVWLTDSIDNHIDRNANNESTARFHRSSTWDCASIRQATIAAKLRRQLCCARLTLQDILIELKIDQNVNFLDVSWVKLWTRITIADWRVFRESIITRDPDELIAALQSLHHRIILRHNILATSVTVFYDRYTNNTDFANNPCTRSCCNDRNAGQARGVTEDLPCESRLIRSKSISRKQTNLAECIATPAKKSGNCKNNVGVRDSRFAARQNIASTTPSSLHDKTNTTTTTTTTNTNTSTSTTTTLLCSTCETSL